MRRRLNVILDVTERCNLKCVMCHFSQSERINFPPFNVKLSEDGNMPVEIFEKIASDLFPKARRVALACAAEALIHPRFKEIVSIAGRYGVPDLWFPTNLLALSESSARAIFDANVSTIAASIDGVTKETYEKIRVGAKWEALLSRLDLLRQMKREEKRRRPRLRIIFTWMKSNRKELADLPAFAAEQGAEELDVRYVSEAFGVDVSSELLNREDPRELNAELARTAKEAVRRGLWLFSYPEFEGPGSFPKSLVGKARRRLWRLRAGMDRPERWIHAWNQKLHGCGYPDRVYVIRPNGAVSPCIYWQEEPIGFYPADSLAAIASGAPLKRIREGLRSGHPIGTCDGCQERGTASLYRFRGARSEPRSTAHLPAHPG